MKITLLSSSVGDQGAMGNQYATSYLINDTIAIDAGSIGFYRTPHDQAAVGHLFLSHTHLDHLASLPIFLENIAGLAASTVNVYASEDVAECLRRDLFNGRVWADFLTLTHQGKPFVAIHRIADGHQLMVDGVKVTPIAVNHTVPTMGFLIEDDRAAIVITSDTGPTEEIWQRAEQTPNLKAVFLEATFPNDQQNLADLTLHLTPSGFEREMQKLTASAKYYAVHLKAKFRDQVERELLALGRSNLEIARFDTLYEF